MRTVANRPVDTAGDDRTELGADTARVDVARVPHQVVTDLGSRLARHRGAEHCDELIAHELPERADGDGRRACRARDSVPRWWCALRGNRVLRE